MFTFLNLQLRSAGWSKGKRPRLGLLRRIFFMKLAPEQYRIRDLLF